MIYKKVRLAPHPPALDHLLMRSLWPLMPDRLGQLGTPASTASCKPEVIAEERSPEFPSPFWPAPRHRPHHGPAGSPMFSELIHSLAHQLVQKGLLSPLGSWKPL